MEKLLCKNRYVTLTHIDRILFKNPTIRKKEVIDYYHAIAEKMLPFLKNRPLTMQRFPEGIFREGFYHKDVADSFPSWIKTAPIKKKEGGTTRYVICNNQATLVYLANLSSITQHLWLSRVDKIEYPDRMIFDLDPSGVSFRAVCKAACELKAILEEKNLRPFVMTTGSRGLHVVVSLKRNHTFEQVKSYAHLCAQECAARNPKLFTLDVAKKKRTGKIYIDILRNSYAQTAVAPYALRALRGAPLATPLFWEELSNKKLTSNYYTIKTIFKRFETHENPWKDLEKKTSSLSIQ